MLVALGGRAARQGNQAGLRPVIHLAVPAGLDPVLEHTVQSAPGEAPLDVEYRALGHVQGLGHPGRRPSLAGFSKMRARAVTLAEPFPARTICSGCLRSSCVSLTEYFCRTIPPPHNNTDYPNTAITTQSVTLHSRPSLTQY